jgi:hypothetical protein
LTRQKVRDDGHVEHLKVLLALWVSVRNHTLLLSNLDEEPVYDTTKLSHRELTRLSLKIVGKYNEIAGLANLGKGEVENVYRDHINYPEPKDKANQILTMISAQTNFSRKELGDYLKEAGLRDLVDEVVQGKLRRFPDDAGSPNETTES